MGDFAGGVVTSTDDPRLLAELEAAADAAPEGQPRWRCLVFLADALKNAGRSNASLPFYEQAATLARSAAEAGGENARQAWVDLGWITSNWGSALRGVGDLDAGRQRRIESGEAFKKAGTPAIHVIGGELEALRIDIIQGRAAQALPEV